MSDFIKAPEVAVLIGLESGAALLCQRDHLQEHHDFPAPMPVPLRPLQWRRAAVLAWIEHHGLPAREAATLDPARFGPNVRLLAAARRA